MTLQDFETELKAVCPDTYELAAPKGLCRFCAWRVYRHITFYDASGQPIEVPNIELYICTQNLRDTLVNDVKALLHKLSLGFEEKSTEYDDEKALIRTVLDFPFLDPEKEYFSYNFFTEPALHADGKPGAIIYNVQLHFYCALERDYRARIKAIKNFLLNAGCTYPTAFDASDDYMRHVTLEFEYVDGDV